MNIPEIKYDTEYLIKIAFHNFDLWSHHEQMAVKSMEARGIPCYGLLPKMFPIHRNRFRNMHNRIDEQCLETSFKRDLEGFAKFVEYLGPVPTEMKVPSLGRIDHSKGYVIGNFTWQELRDNIEEMANRTKSSDNKFWVNSPGCTGYRWYNDGQTEFFLRENNPLIEDAGLVRGRFSNRR
jgi:hypothetical protein